MTTYKFLILLMVTSSIYSQSNYKSAEGFYELSSFEMAAGMYLLEDQTFFYFASFGNVDLKIYGTYTLSNSNQITLFPNPELTKKFHFYWLHNPENKNYITFYYKQPYEQNAEQLLIEIDGKYQEFPKFTSAISEVSMRIEFPQSEIIKIGYKNPDALNAFQYELLETAKLHDGINEIKIFHNYYAEMTVAVSQLAFKLENGILTDLNEFNQKTIPKKEINPDIKNQVLAFIADKKSETTINRDGKIYEKIDLTPK
ncbi:hypothetical protein [Bizionia sp.]|uniref:hypothetical protein n=1 Tax=Bizionia sp. TaxID=1954480 RepID=UPI003A93402A